MELAERYAYEVYKQKSFTAAAKALYISQPGLSAMITKLEKNLGFRIFDRSTSPLSLTPEGRIYMEYLQDMITEESNMLHRIRQLAESENETLSVSVFSQTAYYLFASLCAEFSKRHPNVSILADIGNNSSVGLLAEKLKNNILDVVLTDNFPEKDCLSIPVFTEQLLIATNRKLCKDPSILAYAVSREEVLTKRFDENKKLQDLTVLRDIPILSFDDQVTTARTVEKLFPNDYNRSIYHIKNSRNLMMHYNMMREGLGATIADASHLIQPVFNDPDIVYFIPAHPSATRTLYCVIKESRQAEPILKSFISAVKELLTTSVE